MTNANDKADALVAALRELRDTGDVSDWGAMETALTAAIEALAAHPAESYAALLRERDALREVAKHCEEMLMRYSIDRADGEAIAEEALAIIRAALSEPQA